MKPSVLFAAASAIWLAAAAHAENMTMAVTTSFHNSGLSDILLPQIALDTGIDVQLLVVGTGQALRLGQSGDVDAILVHSKVAEEEFVAEGSGTHRREIMYNDFVIVGPSADPAGISEAANAATALTAIAGAGAPFVSRGDDSGTHKKELALWHSANIDPMTDGAGWYRAAGAGMGASLNTASGMNAYILSDRASWLKFGNKGDLTLLFAGDPVLFNQYAYIPVNPDKHSHIRADNALKVENWLTGPVAKKLINEYTVNGETLFTFNAKEE